MTAVFAHRGCTDGFVDNTVEAFAEAARRGADGVELDVRLTADGALAVHHDAEIPGIGPVCGLQVADLPPYVPLLAEALAACEGMAVNVEIKNAPQDPGFDPTEAVASLTAAAIEEAGWTARVIVSSFQVATLRAVRVADGRLVLGALWGFGDDPAAALPAAAEAGFAAVHPFVSVVTPELVARAHELGLAVNVWTVNAPDDLRAMVDLEVDAVITDRLSEAIAAAQGPSQAPGAPGAGEGAPS
jgi:glycerophosphoryl diester phosphodiesterase